MRVSAIFVYLAVSGLAHALGARWALLVFPRLASRRRAIVAAAIALTVLPVVARALTWSTRSAAATTLFAASMIEVLALVLAVVPATYFSMALRWASRRSRAAAPSAPEAVTLSRREALERGAGLACFGATSLALGWGAVRGRHAFALEEVVVRVAGWPRALEGYTIAQVSDVHVGFFVGERELEEGFELVRRIKPDLVVATGDLVDFVASSVDPLAARLAAVPARDGAFAILGNHDHYAGPGDVAARVRAAGVRVLSNEALAVRSGDGGGFVLAGVDDIQGRRAPRQGFRGPDLGRALAGVRPDRPRVLLAHQPMYFPESAGRVALQLSGHTHGGQINPGFRPADVLMRYVAGRYEQGGSTMWVNRGFGVAGPPSRLGAPPEVTKIVLVGA